MNDERTRMNLEYLREDLHNLQPWIERLTIAVEKMADTLENKVKEADHE